MSENSSNAESSPLDKPQGKRWIAIYKGDDGYILEAHYDIEYDLKKPFTEGALAWTPCKSLLSAMGCIQGYLFTGEKNEI